MVICLTCCQRIYGFHDFLKEIANNQSHTNNSGDGRTRAQHHRFIKIENNEDLKEQLSEDDTCDEIKHDITIEETKTNLNQSSITAKEKPRTTEENNDIISHWKSYLECGICQQQHVDFAALSQHFKLQHPTEKTHLICCEHKLHTLYGIADHARYHLNPETFKCHECGKCSLTQKLLLQHISEKHDTDGGSEKFVCSICNKTCLSAHNLKKHMKCHTLYKCLACAESFKYLANFYKHFKGVHAQLWLENKNARSLLYEAVRASGDATRSETQDDFEEICKQWQTKLGCGICQKSHTNFVALSHHFQLEHPKQKAHILCCNRKRHSRRDIADHARFHMNPATFKCQECAKCFQSRFPLNKHMRRVHFATVETNFMCSVCQKCCHSALQLKEHMARHTNTQLYKCLACTATYRHLTGLYRHLKTAHSEAWSNRKNTHNLYETVKAINYYDEIILQWKSHLECGICQKMHASFSALRKHFSLEHANKKAYILCCERKLLTRHEIADHANFHMNPEIFKCSKCDKCFAHRRLLRLHIRDVHVAENRFKCNICSNIYKSRNTITTHLRTQHTKEFTETGNICSLYATIEATNIEADNNKSNKPNATQSASKKADNIIAQWQPFAYLQCGICQKPYEGFSLLSQHFRHEHANEKAHIVCCERKLMTRWKIAEHASFHLNPDAFKCLECDKVFGNKFLLDVHTRDIHNTKSKLVCKFCGNLFGYRKSLDLHLKTFHPQVWSDRKNIPDLYDLTEAGNEKAYVEVIMQWKSNLDCGICQEPYESFSNLTEHFGRQHSKEKPHILCCKRKISTLPKIAEHASFHLNPEACKCTECDKSFESPILLSVHIKNTHSTSDKFSCNICDKVFGYRRNLNQHLKKQHAQMQSQLNSNDLMEKSLAKRHAGDNKPQVKMKIKTENVEDPR